MRLVKIILAFSCLVISYLPIKAQVKGDSVRIVLDTLSKSDIPQLNDTINLSLTNISVSELLRSVSNHIGVNINVSPIKTVVHNNYSKIRTKDLIFLLCSEYNLEMTVYGSIISLKEIAKPKYILKVSSNEKQQVSFELKNAPMDQFAKEFAKHVGINIFIPPEFKSYKIDGFVQDLNVSDALYSIGKANKFNFLKENDNLFILEKLIGNEELVSPRKRKAGQVQKEDGRFLIKKKNGLLTDIILDAAEKTNSYVAFTEKIDAKKNINVRFGSFTELLNSVLLGTKYTYKIQDSTYFIGLKSKKDMHSHYLYQFNNRRVDSLSILLPDGIKESVELVEYPEINSIFISGEMSQLIHLKRICSQLDQQVPLVLIDVILVESADNFNLSTGIDAGVTKPGEDVPQTGGTILSGTDFTLSGSSVNNILNRVGLSSIGKVKSNFYIQLKAMETKGLLEVKSTPKLSTLSGKKASLSIGETVYYEEQILSLYGSQNPGQQEQVIYKPIDARLGVDIRPVVTGNGFVNLNIEVIQSSFTERVSEKGPPGIVSREFKSMIRVKNGETVILGGLQTVRNEQSRSGVPFLSRIPILNWFFTSKTKNKSDDKFTIFISPTIIN